MLLSSELSFRAILQMHLLLALLAGSIQVATVAAYILPESHEVKEARPQLMQDAGELVDPNDGSALLLGRDMAAPQPMPSPPLQPAPANSSTRDVWIDVLIDYLNNEALHVESKTKCLFPQKPAIVFGPFEGDTSINAADALREHNVNDVADEGEFRVELVHGPDDSGTLNAIVRGTAFSPEEQFFPPNNTVSWQVDDVTVPNYQEAATRLGQTNLRAVDLMDLAIETFNRSGGVYSSHTNNEHHFARNFIHALNLTSAVVARDVASYDPEGLVNAAKDGIVQYGNIPMSWDGLLEKGTEFTKQYAIQEGKVVLAQLQEFAFGADVPLLFELGEFPFTDFDDDDVVPTIDKIFHYVPVVYKKVSVHSRFLTNVNAKVKTFSTKVYTEARWNGRGQASYARFSNRAVPKGVTIQINAYTAGAMAKKVAQSVDLREISRSKSVAGKAKWFEKWPAKVMEKISKGLKGDPIGWIFNVVTIAIDFKKGKKKQAWTCLGGGIAATAAAAIGGPPGWIAAGIIAIATMLAVLFMDVSPLGHTNDQLSVIQYMLTGDKDKSGAEDCNKLKRENGEEENCEVRMGPGYLALFFRWEFFDAVVFLLAANEGHSMSTAEIAEEVYIIDKTIENDGDDQLLTLTCDTDTTNCGRKDCPISILPPEDCENPVMRLNRENARLPILEQSAAEIYPKVVDGSCKMIQDPVDGVRMPAMGVNYTGRPAMVACDLPETGFHDVENGIPPAYIRGNEQYSLATGDAMEEGDDTDSQAPGSANPVEGGTLYSYTSPEGTTTDGSTDRAFEPVPYAKEFERLNPSNSVCISGDGGGACFPSGRFQVHQGDMGFNQALANKLEMPLGASLTIESRKIIIIGNKTPENKDFALAMAALAKEREDNKDKGFFMVDIPASINPPNVAFCLETEGLGDCFILGVGADWFTAAGQNRVKSFVSGGGARGWVYADYLGSKLGMEIPSGEGVGGRVDDLTHEGFKGGSWSENIKAAYIQAAD
ncbi:MAG: hypothetical protein M1833_003466 [Piccolia ochrophora]|nr:MAG: hypothetical protein M1833_003466 [Piccolia ochrophora]